MKKLVSIMIGVVCLTLCLGFSTACTDDWKPGGGSVKTYVMEAEYINLDGLSGASLSGEASGVDMIYGTGEDADIEKGWSSGYYVGFTYSSGLTFNFVFNSDKEETATVIVRVGSEMGNITLDPDSFAIKVNGTEIQYGSMYLEGSTMDVMAFSDKTVTTTASLKKGENTISLVILNNTVYHGTRIGGPMIDCIKIKTKATLTWTDKTDNPSKKGAI